MRERRLPILRWWVAAAAATVILLLTAGALVWLLFVAGGDPDRAGARIDAIRTGLSVGAGLAALSGLLLAFRRQRSTEQAAADVNHDAAERRITELYTAAAEQLGSDKAPVRLAGLYALERLGQENPAHRQTILDVICAYLRMPFNPPKENEEGVGAAENDYSRVELEVRLTAQRILAIHLRATTTSDEPGPKFWADIGVNLTRATLVDFDFDFCRTSDAVFDGATFVGPARFEHSTFDGGARFDRGTFVGDARFDRGTFVGDARFHHANFNGNAFFLGATFTDDAFFLGATFTDDAYFARATFTGNAFFARATFADNASFLGATFSGDTHFTDARGKEMPNTGWPKGWRVEPDPGGGLGWLVRARSQPRR